MEAEQIPHQSPLVHPALVERVLRKSRTQMVVKDADAYFPDGANYAMPARGSLAMLAQGNTPVILPTKESHQSLHDILLSKCLTLFAVFATLIMLTVLASPAHAESRLKDIVNFEGVRDNLLMGYGLVVGLPGTGDKLKNNEFTSQSLIAFLERQGVNTRGTELKSKNIAAVTITAVLPPFARSGGKINVSVSAMGDAKSLQGGILLATPLYGADGEVYVVAQGPINISGIDGGIGKGVPTNGFIADGGIIEREVSFSLNKMASLNIGLRNPDVLTAKHVAEAINKHLGVQAAEMVDPGTVHLRVPIDYKGNTAKLLAEIEQLPVATDQPAKVVIDEASGTVVMGENVRIDTVAVAQGNLIVRIEEGTAAQAAAGTAGLTVTAPAVAGGEVAVSTAATPEAITVDNKSKLTIMQHGASLRDLVAGLNALGVGPRDLINILQTIKAAGALQAEIVAK